eukprot:TRINITY_DN2529_c0_g1_i1.p1 TRINITY_DN2529_c0_g1~~TRINITY_DN2529_c0_g1_i1.p1  ORF type:complete len:852 (-),score=368.62 TRINITY_DN2529_c0_g1_i1:252-2807(-)
MEENKVPHAEPAPESTVEAHGDPVTHSEGSKPVDSSVEHAAPASEPVKAAHGDPVVHSEEKRASVENHPAPTSAAEVVAAKIADAKPVDAVPAVGQVSADPAHAAPVAKEVPATAAPVSAPAAAPAPAASASALALPEASGLPVYEASHPTHDYRKKMNKGDLGKLRTEKGTFLTQQSVVVAPHAEGFSATRRSHMAKDGLVTVEKTLWQNFTDSVHRFPNDPMLGTREALGGGKFGAYQFITYKQGYEKSLYLAAGLAQLGLTPKKHLGIYSKNREEYVLLENAANSQSQAVVAIYDTFGEDTIEYIINHAELSVVATSTFKDTTSKLVRTAKGAGTHLRHIVQFETVTDEHRKAFEGTNVQLHSYADILAKGTASPIALNPPAPTDVAVIMYTSGTTGMPKGVIHTHRGIVSTGFALAKLDNTGGFYKTDVYLSYLPLAHIFEKISITLLMGVGAKIGFYTGDARSLMDDIGTLKPTVLCGVPRVFERIYSKILGDVETAGGIKKWLFTRALNAKKDSLTPSSKKLFEEAEGSTPIYNKIVFSKAKAALGGSCRLIISGAAPLSPNIQEFLKVVFGCPVIQGYGLTETCAAGSLTDKDDHTTGHTGFPHPSIEIKLADVPEMNYVANKESKPEGEVWIRGVSVAQGYYKDAEKTKEEFDADGWFHTGDVGRFNENGTLTLIDRKKNIFKLSQGEYVAAEKLELVFKKSLFVGQIFVYGDSHRSFLVAVVRPEEACLKNYAAEKGWGSDYAELCKKPEVNKAILADLTAKGKEGKIQGFEAIKGIILTPIEWTAENGLTTPTMKLKRNVLRDHFKPQIDTLYDECEAALNAKPATAAAPAPVANGKEEKK